MTHFTTAVILPKDAEYTSQFEGDVARLMLPFQEGDGEWFADGSRWDWYQVGGRFDGQILGLEFRTVYTRCDLCSGTGTRPGGLEEFGAAWVAGCHGCNGCDGTGKSSEMFSDEYNTAERNVTTMTSVSADYTPSSFIDPDGNWHEQGRVGWFGVTIEDENGNTKDETVAAFDQEWAAARDEYAGHVVVGLDCHV